MIIIIICKKIFCSEKIRDELHGTPNGTFLVRDSREKGNYTLVVRIDGVNKLLRIACSGNNKYGFYNNSVDPPALVEFPSVPALVEYFKRVPLTEYNPSLDITLFHPLARVSIGINEINIDRPYYHVSRTTLQYTNTKFPPNLLWHFLLTRKMKTVVKNLDIAIYQR